MRVLARDPFARTTLVRDTLQPTGNQSCDFCGGTGITRRRRIPFLFRFGTAPDAVHPRVGLAPRSVLLAVLPRRLSRLKGVPCTALSMRI
jgi:hypothetical protein